MNSKHPIIASAILLLLGSIACTAADKAATKTNPSDPFGLIPVKCWFPIDPGWPTTHCFRMRVPENHSRVDLQIVSFPVIRFKSFNASPSGAPVLHLGAGGPGAPMYLESADAVKTVWQYHDEISLKKGRDLIVIDPRGSGLSWPLLSCQTFVDNLLGRLAKNLTMVQEWTEIDRDYDDCIARLATQGIDFKQYNSRSVALDVEMLRKFLEIEQWVLIGVSYAAVYAQLIAREFPTSVESLILDSATFPNLAPHERYLQSTLAPYDALLNYCRFDANCDKPIDNLKHRFWKLYQELSDDPISVTLEHPYDSGQFKLVLNGERFLGALYEGSYGVTIFEDLPKIIVDLENRRVDSLMPYLELSMLYLFDRSYGDVSSEAHYCFDIKPYTDFDKARAAANKLADGHMKRVILLSLDWGDNCDQMNIKSGYPSMAENVSIDIPALFLHGEFDTATPMSDIIDQKKYFPRSRLIKFKLSHSILSSDECAEFIAAKFVDNTNIEVKDLNCF